MTERHTTSGHTHPQYGKITAEPAAGQSPMTRASYGLEFKPYVYGGVTGDPPEVTRDREYHREVTAAVEANARILGERAARRQLADLGDPDGDTCDPEQPAWNWLIEMRDEENGGGT